MVDVSVEFEYEGQEEDELTMKVGDIISNVKKMDGGWWEGVLNGKRGVFPDNFVKEIKKPEPVAVAPVAAKKAIPQSSSAPKAAPQTAHVAELANKLGNMNVNTSQNAVKKAPAEKSGGRAKTRVKVTFAYNPVNDDELRLEVGEVFELLKQEEEGWWEGSLNGKVGVFPSNFVEIIESSEDTDVAAVDGGVSEIKGKKVMGIGLGKNIFGDDGPRLRKTPDQPKAPEVKSDPVPDARTSSVERKVKKVMPVQPEKSVPAPTLPPKENKLEKAKVLFAYVAENEDELSLEEGQVVVVLEKDLEDSGWWKGEMNGKTGVFPDNFVKLLPPEEAAKPKKPPPPAVNAQSAAPPAARPAKPAEYLEAEPKVPTKEKPAKAPLTQKASMPPPVGKKPAPRPEEPVTDDQKAGQHGTSPLEAGLESGEPTQLLNQLNNNRPAGPSNRRPAANPKALLQSTDGVQEDVGTETRDVPDDNAPPPLERRKNRPKSLQASAPTLVAREPRADVEKEPGRKPAPDPVPQPTAVSRGFAEPVEAAMPAAMPAAITADVADIKAELRTLKTSTVPRIQLEELKAEFKTLKGNTVPRSQYEDLLSQFGTIRDELTGMKDTLQKRTVELMGEVDEEKKVRLGMQVEIERLKKLVMS